ncbi:MAG: hypothetical protein E7502_00845 [Ruminococcus sp.]|nr:hypothetical protein [Ruminococcus sp.]
MDKISYLKGLLAGLDIDAASKEGKVFYALCDALDEMRAYTEELEDRIMELEELCDILDEDLGDVEELLLDDEDDCDGCDLCSADAALDDEDFEEQYETICPTCGNCIVLDEGTLEEGETTCPNCGEELEFDFDELDLEELDSLDGEAQEEE